MKKVIVLSLGGSLIIPDKIDFEYLHKLKKSLIKLTKDNKFVIVCGGGAIARTYIDSLRKEGKKGKELSLAGIRATRMNAMFMMQFFSNKNNHYLPKELKQVTNLINKEDIVFCGALRYLPNETSDGTAAHISKHLKADFVNLTNVKGLYDKDPNKYKSAKLIEKISWNDFYNIARKIKFEAGQHFVLDQEAAKLIKENKIPTCIIGKDISQLENFVKGKRFIGTTIRD
jgi:uridylate kinase